MKITMNRKEAYAFIKENGLEALIEECYGTNFTRTTTDKLVSFIQAYQNENGLISSCDETSKPEGAMTEAVAKKDDAVCEVNSAYEAACLTFLGILKDAGILDDLLGKID